jgi:hypothetical protein
MGNSGELIGRLIAIAAFACLVLYFLVRALGAGPLSRRLANFALSCGLGGLAVPTTSSPAPAVIGVHALLGLAALGFAVAALRSRCDGGCGVVRPIIGIVLGVFQLAGAVALLMFSSFTSTSNPWVYQAPDAAYRLTLPSDRWQHTATKPTPDGSQPAVFVHTAPFMQARVLRVRHQQSEQDFVKTAEDARAFLVEEPGRRNTVRFREGTNAAGNPYRYYTAMDAGAESGQVYIGHSFTWNPRTHVLVAVLFEGPLRMLSEAGRAAEMEAFETSAATICLSVE